MIRKDDRMLSRQTQIKPSLSTYIIIHPGRASPTARMQMNSWALTPSKSHCLVTFVAPFFCFVTERWGKNCSGVETWGFWPVLRDGLGCWTQAEAQGRWQCCERGCCPAKSIDSSLNFASLEQAMGHWYWFGWGEPLLLDFPCSLVEGALQRRETKLFLDVLGVHLVQALYHQWGRPCTLLCEQDFIWQLIARMGPHWIGWFLAGWKPIFIVTPAWGNN